MQEKYAILKKLAHQRARDEVSQILNLGEKDIIQNFMDAKIKAFESDIVIEELKLDKKRSDELASKFSSILQEIAIGYVVCDKNGAILSANKLGQKAFNIPSLEKSAGRPLALSIAYEERTRFLDWHSRVIAGMGENETTFKTMGDSLASVAAKMLSNGELLISVIDVTKSQSELKLLHLIKLGFDNSTDSIIITDENVKIIYVNTAFVRSTGYSKHEAIGKNPSMLKSGIYGHDFYEKLWQEISDSGSWKGQIADKNKSGKLSIHQTNITAIKDGNKTTNYIAIFSDITEHNEMNEKILELSIYDPLTRLPNRQMFKNRIEELCVSKFGSQEGFTLMFVDLDNFKYINDTYGHSFGDELLIEVSRRLKHVVRRTDLVARLGGDEFTIILEGLIDTAGIQTVAEGIVSALCDDIRLSIGQSVNISCSIGIAVYPNDARSNEDLLKYADIAMYKAKEEGKNRYFFYNEKMSTQSIRLSRLKNVLPGAEKHGEIYLKYQPLFCTKTLQAVGMEALARWHNVSFGEVSPFEFITMAEKTGYIRTLGKWLYESACNEMSDSGLYVSNLKELAINVSGVQLKEADFVSEILAITNKSSLTPKNIVLEVTESVLIENMGIAVIKLEELREMGFRIALDDFGTGYSSLSYLQKLPIDIVKVDKSFVDHIHTDKKSMDIVKTIITLSHHLGKKTVAEGVEYKEQAELLIEADCDILQGYLFSKPIKLKYFDLYMDGSKILKI